MENFLTYEINKWRKILRRRGIYLINYFSMKYNNYPFEKKSQNHTTLNGEDKTNFFFCISPYLYLQKLNLNSVIFTLERKTL